jgi:hypothetical protein
MCVLSVVNGKSLIELGICLRSSCCAWNFGDGRKKRKSQLPRKSGGNIPGRKLGTMISVIHHIEPEVNISVPKTRTWSCRCRPKLA